MTKCFSLTEKFVCILICTGSRIEKTKTERCVKQTLPNTKESVIKISVIKVSVTKISVIKIFVILISEIKISTINIF